MSLYNSFFVWEISFYKNKKKLEIYIENTDINVNQYFPA